MTPQAIAHYRITSKLGAGGMGEVYRATDTKLGREVAIKVLPDNFAQDAGRMARFDREARVLASLNHPNIAAIYDVEDRALIIELVEGPTLAERIAAGPVPEKEALDIARQIVEALEYAHGKGIIHRDLKPANVKVTPEGVVKVLDFGLAKAVMEEPRGNPESSPTLTIRETQAGVIVGTAAYMAPEQARGKTVDKRVDIWAFGVVLYEMLMGSRLFAGEAISDTLAAVLKTEPDWSRTPLKARRLLMACLEKDPKQRLRDIGDAWRLLEVAETSAARSHSAIWPWAVAAAFALALVGTLFLHRTPPPSAGLLQLSVEVGPDVILGNSRGSFAISPDGRRLAFRVRGADGRVRLGIRRLDRSEAVTTLSSTEGANNIFFSPDGQWIGFSAEHKLKKVALEGGPPVTLCDASGMVGGSWGDDGYIIATLGVGMKGLSRIPSSGGVPTPVTVLAPEKGELRHSWPQVLPGSQTVLFSAYTIAGGLQAPNIEILSLRSGERKVLRTGFFARYLPSGHLVYIHENTLFAAPFDLSRLALAGSPRPVLADISTSRTALNALDAGGEFDFSQTGTFVCLSGNTESQRSIFWLEKKSQIQPLHSAPGIYTYPRFSPDGKRLAFAMEDGQGREDIWVKDLQRDTTSRLTFLTGANEAPIWTPDGRNIVFLSQNRSAPGIYMARTDRSGEPQRLLQITTRIVPHSISPDGKLLAGFQSLSGRGLGIWTAELEGTGDHLRLGNMRTFHRSQLDNLERDPAFSPDGRWLAYGSNESGSDEVYVAPLSGQSGGAQISRGGGTFPIWSHDGSQLFYRGRDGRLMFNAWKVAGDSFVPGKPEIWSDQRILSTSPPSPMYDIAPDGKRLAAILYADGTSERKPITHVTLLLNFFDDLRLRVPANK